MDVEKACILLAVCTILYDRLTSPWRWGGGGGPIAPPQPPGSYAYDHTFKGTIHLTKSAYGCNCNNPDKGLQFHTFLGVFGGFRPR